jgi:hypothetical protein
VRELEVEMRIEIRLDLQPEVVVPHFLAAQADGEDIRHREQQCQVLDEQEDAGASLVDDRRGCDERSRP